MFIKEKELSGRVHSVIRETEQYIQITVQAKDSKTAEAIVKEIHKSVRKARRLAETPLAGKRIRYTVIKEATLVSAQILPEDCAMQRKNSSHP